MFGIVKGIDIMIKTYCNQKNSGWTILPNKRNCNIDLIKVVACIAVVGLHTLPKDLSIMTASLYYLCGFAVPLFFMSSGFFLLNRNKVGYKYVICKCIRIIRVIFLWNIIIFILKLGKQLVLKEEGTINLLTFVKEFAKSFVQKGDLWQFWYLGAILIIYILLPILSKLNCKEKRRLMLVCGLAAVVIEIGSFLYGRPLQKSVIQTFRVWTWLFYFLLGSEMSRIKNWISTHSGIIFHFLLYGLFTALILVYQNYVGSKIILEKFGRLHAEYFYDSFFEMIWIVLMFTFLLRLEISGWFSNCIFKIASLTMGIYIIHPVVLKVTLVIIGNCTFFRSMLYWITTLVGAMIITWSINKLPFGKYLVKI